MIPLLLCFSSAKRYVAGQEVPVYANKISPIYNPSETYDYYALPFCPYLGTDKSRHSFSDGLLGNRHKRTPIVINFTVAVSERTLCKVPLSPENFQKFIDAIQDDYYYELSIDKLPVWSFVGSSSPELNESFLFSHHAFTLSYNKNRIIDVSLESKNPFKMEVDRVVKFTYSVEWVETTRGKADRASRYKDDPFFSRNVRYYSLAVSVFVTIALILVVVCILLRSLGNDFVRIRNEEEVPNFEGDFRPDRGWKMLHGDVFRPPPFPFFLSTAIGIGAHFFFAIILFLLFVVVFSGAFERSSKVMLAFFSYSVTAFLGGYFAAGLYKRWGGGRWIFQLIAMAFGILVLFVSTELVLNLVALGYRSTRVIKFSSWFVVVLWYLCVVIPLLLFGGIVGRHWFLIGPNPSRVAALRRLIPPMPFYLRAPLLCLTVSLASAASVSSEIHYIIVALWTYRMSYVWSFTLVVLGLLLTVVACVTVVAVYQRLSAENYHWQWISFAAPACVAAFVMLYGCYYFVFMTEMEGVMQTLYYFAYTAMLSGGVGVVCGFVGFAAAALFARKIYTNIKTD